MDRKYLAKFASKNLLSHKLRTFLTVVGMVIGVSAITFLIAFAFGVERIVTSEITGGNAFELVDIGTGNSQIINLNDENIGKIRQISGISSLHTTSNLAAIAKKPDGSSADISCFATTPEYMQWSSVEIKWGDPLPAEFSDEVDGSVVVSSGLTDYLGIGSPDQTLGKKIMLDLVLPTDLTGKDKQTLENQEFSIVGVIKNDTPAVYTRVENLKQSSATNYSQAKAEVKNEKDIEKVRIQVENLGFRTEYVGETVTQVERVFSFFKIILGGFGLIAMIVAALAMFNTLTISLLERTKEIALLKILGMKRKDISYLFLTEAIAMGVIGGILGVVAGIITSNIANSIFNHFAIKSGGEPVLVFAFPLWFVGAVFIFSVIVGFLTGIYPARRAMRINALDVMRYE